MKTLVLLGTVLFSIQSHAALQILECDDKKEGLRLEARIDLDEGNLPKKFSITYEGDMPENTEPVTKVRRRNESKYKYQKYSGTDAWASFDISIPKSVAGTAIDTFRAYLNYYHDEGLKQEFTLNCSSKMVTFKDQLLVNGELVRSGDSEMIEYHHLENGEVCFLGNPHTIADFLKKLDISWDEHYVTGIKVKRGIIRARIADAKAEDEGNFSSQSVTIEECEQDD